MSWFRSVLQLERAPHVVCGFESRLAGRSRAMETSSGFFYQLQRLENPRISLVFLVFCSLTQILAVTRRNLRVRVIFWVTLDARERQTKYVTMNPNPKYAKRTKKTPLLVIFTNPLRLSFPCWSCPQAALDPKRCFGSCLSAEVLLRIS